ncbi:hypothetical protein PROSTU_01545 [Providencia stuartii ATCC 25827]|uniref:Uncharacterized protein n=1 Tax=Providencia stuartii ATCC 25827 TaxID=471874 RepID=A0AA86YV85_PROST|nr:hypothetical protein PROSTU_01545 [Providencia stuartii ATCC 25827]
MGGILISNARLFNLTYLHHSLFFYADEALISASLFLFHGPKYNADYEATARL